MISTILNGNAFSNDTGFEQYVADYAGQLQGQKHEVRVHTLRDMDIKFCIGCWTCWWKTPGLCVHKDDMEKIYRDVVKSDLLILAAPLVVGFPSVLLKKTQDRLIPLLLSYMEIDQGEFHHRKRYDNYPKLGVLVSRENDTDEEDLRIVEDIYKRFAVNFKTEVAFFHTTEKPVEELVNETGGI